MGPRTQTAHMLILHLLFIGAALAAPRATNGETKYPKMTPEAAASCDPDYGWINGPDGTNKCYMVLRENEITNCGLGSGGGGGGVCTPDYYNCYAECYDINCCYDYSCSGGSYYYSLNWYEAMQCCNQNYGFLAQPASQSTPSSRLACKHLMGTTPTATGWEESISSLRECGSGLAATPGTSPHGTRGNQTTWTTRTVSLSVGRTGTTGWTSSARPGTTWAPCTMLSVKTEKDKRIVPGFKIYNKIKNTTLKKKKKKKKS